MLHQHLQWEARSQDISQATPEHTSGFKLAGQEQKQLYYNSYSYRKR